MSISPPSDVRLDVERILEEQPGFSGGVNAGMLMNVGFLQLPIMVFVGTKFGSSIGWPVFCTCVATTVLMTVLLRFAIFILRHRWSAHVATVIAFGPWVMFSGALFWFASREGGPKWHLALIAAIWIVTEVRAVRRARAVSDAAIARAVRQQVRLCNGEWLYKHKSNRLSDLAKAEAQRGIRGGLLSIASAAFVWLLPSAFLVSLVLDQNFDARYMIVGSIQVALGIGTGFLTADGVLTSRILGAVRQLA